VVHVETIVFLLLLTVLDGAILWAEWVMWTKLCGWVLAWPLLLALPFKGLFITSVFVPTVMNSLGGLIGMVSGLRATYRG
jgi:hypothetical protein